MGSSAFPGVPFAMAFIYLLLATAGIKLDPLELAATLPVIYGLLTVLVTYFLGREAGGKATGLAAAFFMAISGAHIGRTHLGWFDDESLSLPLMLTGYLFFLLAIKQGRSERGTVLFSLAAGLSLGLMAASWGAHKFPLSFLPLFSVILAIIGKYRRSLLTATAITFATYSLIAIMVPKLGVGYLFELTLFSGFMALAVLLVYEIASNLQSPFLRRFLPVGFIVAGAAAFAGLAAGGALGIPSLKFISVLLPWLRGELPIVLSVAENQVSTWSALFSDFGLALLLVPLGLYVFLQRGTAAGLFVTIFTIFSTYFASSMVRLVLIASPAVALTAGQGLESIFSSLGHTLSSQRTTKKRVHGLPMGYAVVTPTIILFIIAYSLLPSVYGGLDTRGRTISPIDEGYQPATIVTGSVPVRQESLDWVKALNWMRDNLPDDAVVASWWDYGYWITILGNKTTLIDNGTINSTQIGEVAYAFMSNENVAVEVFRRYKVTHVVIFVTHQAGQRFGGRSTLLGFGDEGKWIWMLRIANQTGHPFRESDYLDANFQPTTLFWEQTLIGKLIPYKPQQTQSGLQHIYQDPRLNFFSLAYASSPPYSSLGYVYVYEVQYPL